MYWSAAQIVAHHASNGCNLQPGDLIGTGTLVDRRATQGSARCWRSARAARSRSTLPSGEARSFLEDGDELTLSARCEKEGSVPIGLGNCVGRVLPAN